MNTVVGSMDGKGPAEALYAVAEARKDLARTESEMVARARAAGLSWEAIALCLGVSKQAVHRKFGKR
ncbi:transcriptional regulator [Arthrobacter sp. ERGS1:01]|uniref:transcriptional regulator n=1 Tax=Arthrobacter sp. ERGS1:01 TaxID=1704044 RepID=UPI0006B61856|nr:transcriptional regulator [Arthrobacter sp. ERGS1:01]ALE05492.1 transcriptional regulator [Arthrobacter sp. ERGS1:01]